MNKLPKKLRVSLILPIIERLKIKLSKIVGPEEHQLMTNMRSLVLDELNRRVKDNEFISLCCLSRSQRDQKGIVGILEKKMGFWSHSDLKFYWKIPKRL